MKVAITGASGMIGKLVLEKCLLSDKIDHIVSLVRKESRVKHQKLVEVVHGNFLKLEEIAYHFDGIDAVFYCVGVYTGAVPADKFREITVDYPIAFAKMLKQRGETCSFLFTERGRSR